METRSPSAAKVVTMVVFALSCFGLLLFLWPSFGGTLPFNPQGYRIKVAFQNAQELAAPADVRIAGVNVGKVVGKASDPQGNRTIVTLELDPRYAPLHEDATAILRTKTLLGETYVQITPGSAAARALADGATLPASHVQHAVQLDEIYDSLDPATRHAFQVWQAELAKAVAGNDQNLSSVLGNLPAFAADAGDILAVLDVEHTAVVNLVRNGGTVFSALSADQAALRGLITAGDATFGTLAGVRSALSDTVHVSPTFLAQSRLTLSRLKTLALDTDPLMRALVPVAQNLAPTLGSLQRLSPSLRKFFNDLGPLIAVSQRGLPATRKVLSGAIPLLAAVGPFLEQLNPIVNWLALHQQLTSDFISNGATGTAAKTTVYGGGGLTCGGVPCGHYLRQFTPNGPEAASYATTRDPNNRGNTYPPPLWVGNPLEGIKGTLEAWDCPGGGERPAGGTDASPNQACWLAPNQGPLLGQPQRFPHVVVAAYSTH